MEQFRSKEEEINALKQRIEALTINESPEEKQEKILEAVREHAKKPVEATLHKKYIVPKEKQEELAQIFDLAPEEHDAKVLKLLALAEDKGILNAVAIARKANNEHLLDDFERALARAIASGAKDKEGNIWPTVAVSSAIIVALAIIIYLFLK